MFAKKYYFLKENLPFLTSFAISPCYDKADFGRGRTERFLKEYLLIVQHMMRLLGIETYENGKLTSTETKTPTGKEVGEPIHTEELSRTEDDSYTISDLKLLEDTNYICLAGVGNEVLSKTETLKLSDSANKSETMTRQVPA